MYDIQYKEYNNIITVKARKSNSVGEGVGR